MANHEAGTTPHDPPPIDLPYESIEAEIKAFLAKMQERHGAIGMLFMFDKQPPEVGGRYWRGNVNVCYAMAKRYVIDQEARWAQIDQPEEAENA